MAAGDIYCELAYAQGKMLEHGAWSGKLPRNITPSDVDMIFDNDGYMMACELSSECCEWSQLTIGQRLLYESFAKIPKCMSVLLKHSVDKSRRIDTREDIDSFAVMLLDDGKIATTPVMDGKRWPVFVESWFASEARVKAGCISEIKQRCVEPQPIITPVPVSDYRDEILSSIEIYKASPAYQKTLC